MKKKIFTRKFCIIIAPIIFSLIVVAYLFSIPIIHFHYDTLDEAVAHDYINNIKSVDGKLEEDDVAFIIYTNSDNVTNYQEYVKDEKGWMSPTSTDLFKKLIIFPGTLYSLEYQRHSGKHIICITGTDDGDYHVYAPTDSIDSEFKHFSKTVEEITVHYWFLAFDELPENYSLKIGDETVPLN